MFLFLMMAGGATVFVALAQTVFSPANPDGGVSAAFARAYVHAEEFSGDWLCNIARIHFATPELLYHAIWFQTLGLYLRGRIGLAVAGVALELYAHPFTGPALALVVSLMCVCDLVLGTDRRRKAFALGGVIVFACLFAGYISWLNLDAGHRALQATWERFLAVIPFRRYVHVYGVWLPLGLAGAILAARTLKEQAAIRCVVLQGLVVFALMNHHLYLPRMIQPAHFARGYLFASLVVLSFLFWSIVRKRFPVVRIPQGVKIAVLCLLSLDNICYAMFGIVRASDAPMTVHRDQARMVRRLAEITPRQFVVSDGNLGQLIPVFTPHRTLLGHWPNTPGYDHASKLLNAWTRTGDAELLDMYPDVTLVCLPRISLHVLQNDPRFLREWTILYETPTHVLYEKHR